ncbi:MAG: D-alanyl-D-alanine carboxypeptidase family protein [Rhizobiaceae bacterium]
MPRIFIFVLALLVAALAVQPAQSNPKYAAYVWDTNSGEVLFERHSGETRFPASLTKIMTLYMVFEALEAGRITLASPIPVSENAAAEVPSKLGMRAGSLITVENAIRSLVTRSANDMATALGEMLGGTEEKFARLMTARARQLGMNDTVFHNAHGLPDERQVTTARDMAVLGYAIREHFPERYHYFQTREFNFAGQTIGNHNRLLGRVTGVDGIKTGFTRASGFNLVSSVRLGGRSIVAVVMGGQSGASRDDHMAALIAEHLPQASAVKSADLIVERPTFLPRVAKVHVMPEAMEAPQFRLRDEAPALASRPAAPATAATTVDVRRSDTGYAMPARGGGSSLPDESRVRAAFGAR